jgi:hypothetical protein
MARRGRPKSGENYRDDDRGIPGSTGPKKGTNYGALSNNYFADPNSHAKAYQAKSIGRPQGVMRNFARTKKRAYMDDVSDVDYMTIDNKYMAIDHAVTAGNGEAAFTNLINKWVERTFTKANDKDITAANETAFKELCCDCGQIVYEVTRQRALREIGNSLTENSATSGAMNTPAYWNQDDWDFMIGQLSKYGPVPQVVYDILNPLIDWVVKTSEAFNRWAEVIPPSYFIPWMPVMKYTDFKTIRANIKTNAIKAKIFMDKVGITYDPGFDYGKMGIRTTTWQDLEVRAHCNHSFIQFVYDAGPAIIKLYPSNGVTVADLKTNTTTAYTGRWFFFNGDTPVAKTHALAPLLGEYHANNIYGLTQVFDPAAVDGNTGFSVAAEDDLIWTQHLLGTHSQYCWDRFFASLSQQDMNKYRNAIVGDEAFVPFNKTRSNSEWIFNNEDIELCYDYGIGQIEMTNNLINLISGLKVGGR